MKKSFQKSASVNSTSQPKPSVKANDKGESLCKKIKHENDDKMPLTMRNYLLMLVGAVVIVLGFVLMSGGTEATPQEFSYDIFSWRRITLAPIVVVAGFAFEIYAILKRF